jgi:hypothetical protein
MRVACCAWLALFIDSWNTLNPSYICRATDSAASSDSGSLSKFSALRIWIAFS